MHNSSDLQTLGTWFGTALVVRFGASKFRHYVEKPGVFAMHLGLCAGSNANVFSTLHNLRWINSLCPVGLGSHKTFAALAQPTVAAKGRFADGAAISGFAFDDRFTSFL